MIRDEGTFHACDRVTGDELFQRFAWPWLSVTELDDILLSGFMSAPETDTSIVKSSLCANGMPGSCLL